jgi:hypothetical protein
MIKNDQRFKFIKKYLFLEKNTALIKIINQQF